MKTLRLLVEASEFKDVNSLLENLCEEWSGAEWCELSVLLAATRALAQLHQSHHWQVSGDTFYGDHMLFDKLYTNTNDEVDKIAEKLVGLATPKMVDAVAISAQSYRILSELYDTNKNISECSLTAEKLYLSTIEFVSTSLYRQNLLTYGLDNLLGDIADKHEEHIYLLKQKLSSRI